MAVANVASQTALYATDVSLPSASRARRDPAAMIATDAYSCPKRSSEHRRTARYRRQMSAVSNRAMTDPKRLHRRSLAGVASRGAGLVATLAGQQST
jgi:hypothetical protein